MEEVNNLFFTLGIIAVEHEDGSIEYKTQVINKGIPIEMIAMKLRALLHTLEDKYFDNFTQELGESFF